MDIYCCGYLNRTVFNSIHDWFPLKHCAEDFAAHARSACSSIRHHTVTGGDNRYTQTTANSRQSTLPRVTPQTRAANRVQFRDHWLAFYILQFNRQRCLNVVADRQAVDIVLVQQYMCNVGLQLGRRHSDTRLTHLLRVADAGQHIGQWILHAHRILLLNYAVGLPAGFNQAGDVPTHGRFAQLMSAQAKLAIDTVRATSNSAAIALAAGARITRHLLQLYLCFPNLFISRIWVDNNCFQLGALGSELLDSTSTL